MHVDNCRRRRLDGCNRKRAVAHHYIELQTAVEEPSCEVGEVVE